MPDAKKSGGAYKAAIGLLYGVAFTIKIFNQQNTHILFTPFGTNIMKQYCGCFV